MSKFMSKTRTFAVPKQLGLADRICNASHLRLGSGGWSRQTERTGRPSGRDKQARI